MDRESIFAAVLAAFALGAGTGAALMAAWAVRVGSAAARRDGLRTSREQAEWRERLEATKCMRHCATCVWTSKPGGRRGRE